MSYDLYVREGCEHTLDFLTEFFGENKKLGFDYIKKVIINKQDAPFLYLCSNGQRRTGISTFMNWLKSLNNLINQPDIDLLIGEEFRPETIVRLTGLGVFFRNAIFGSNCNLDKQNFGLSIITIKTSVPKIVNPDLPALLQKELDFARDFFTNHYFIE